MKDFRTSRREFLAASAVATLGSLALDTFGGGSPSSFAQANERPAPVALGSNIALIDYRAISINEDQGVLGELFNSAETMVDAPTISLRYVSNDRQRFMWLSPVIPVIGPAQSIPLFGMVPEHRVSAESLTNGDFNLCTRVETGLLSEEQSNVTLSATKLDELKSADRYWALVEASNTGRETQRNLGVRGIVRDKHSRIIGMTPSRLIAVLPPRETIRFYIDIDSDQPEVVKLNPFRFSSGNEFDVTIWAGIQAPPTLQGCAMGFPWE